MASSSDSSVSSAVMSKRESLTVSLYTIYKPTGQIEVSDKEQLIKL